MIVGGREATDLVPVLALGFTVASFWWICLRRGRLTIAPPRYQATASTPAQFRLRFPLVFHNAGVRSIVVEELRLVIDDEPLDWITTRTTVRPGSENVADYAAPFVIPGRDTRIVIAEFGANGQPGDRSPRTATQ